MFPIFYNIHVFGVKVMGINATFNNISVMGGSGGEGNKINKNNKTKTCTYIVANSTFLLHAYYDKTVYYCTFWLTILDLKGSL